MTAQTLALAKIVTSTWGANFARARHMYTAALTMSYDSAVWQAPNKPKGLPKLVESGLFVPHNRCRRMVSGAYKTTLVKAVEAETYVAPVQLHQMWFQAKSRSRQRSVGKGHSYRHSLPKDGHSAENRNRPSSSRCPPSRATQAHAGPVAHERTETLSSPSRPL